MTLPIPQDKVLGHYRYVNHARVSAYEALGWRDLGPVAGSHGYWSRLMFHEAQDEPPEPRPEELRR